MSDHGPQAKDIPEQLILDLCRAFHRGIIDQTPEKVLADRYPPKVVLAKMDKMVNRGLLDYGVSLRTAWVVDKTPS